MEYSKAEVDFTSALSESDPYIIIPVFGEIGGTPGLDKPARLTIVPDCETSAATPWERLQEK